MKNIAPDIKEKNLDAVTVETTKGLKERARKIGRVNNTRREE